MPLENSFQNEPKIESESVTSKSYRLTIILGILILLAGAYLVYSLYKSNQVSSQIKSTEKDSKTTLSTNIANNNDNDSNLKIYTQSQVSEKNSKNSCWTIIKENVYDITKYIPNHPGGEEEILKICGKDGSELFAKPMEHKEGGANNILNGFKIGKLAI